LCTFAPPANVRLVEREGSVRLGIPEVLAMLMIVTVGLLPSLAALWALFTLRDIRKDQDEVLNRLEAIERLLQKS
jgi:hypothetical protein